MTMTALALVLQQHRVTKACSQSECTQAVAVKYTTGFLLDHPAQQSADYYSALKLSS